MCKLCIDCVAGCVNCVCVNCLWQGVLTIYCSELTVYYRVCVYVC